MKKKIIQYLASFTATFLLLTLHIHANTASTFITYEPKIPDGLDSYCKIK